MNAKMNQIKDKYRLDASESVFFKRELEHIKSRTYDVKYRDLKSFMLLPVDTSANVGAEEITWRKYSQIGFAKVISDYAKDFPRVDVFGEEVTSKVKSVGASYGYSIQEIRRSQMVGKSLDARRAQTARRAIDEKLDQIAWFGDSETGLQGFINFPGITNYTIPNGAGGNTIWTSKTPDEIIADMSGIVTAIIDSTNGKEIPDTILIPIDQYEYINNTRMTGDSNRTILKFFLENNQHIQRIEWLVELKGIGVGGTDRIMCYTRSDMNVTMELPLPFTQHNTHQTGMEFEVPVEARTGGTIIYYPLSVAYGDGI